MHGTLTPKERGRIRHIDATRRASAACYVDASDTIARRALHRFLPWTRSNYPGLHKGAEVLLGNRVGYGAIAGWLLGRRNPPRWALDMLADMLDARARADIALAAELRAAPAGPGRGQLRRGWAAVRKDGTTPRWRGGRPKRAETPD